MAAPEQESTSSVVVSLISDVGIAIVKIVVAIISGSSAMLSEAIHSSVDSLNSVFLLVGVRLSRRPADDDHPFGHGREVYFWTLIVAVSIFAGGGALSCYEGISHLRQPAPLGRVWPSYVVLAVAGVFEAWTCVAAYREYRRSRRKDLGLWASFRASKDLTTFAVLFENGAALAGVVIAAAGLTATRLMGSPYPDAIASLVIGAILVAVAFTLIRESRGLLVGESVDRTTSAEMRALVCANPSVEKVLRLMTLQNGPHEVLIMMDVRFRDDLTAGALVEVIDDVEHALRDRFHDVTGIFIESDRLIEHTRLPRELGR